MKVPAEVSGPFIHSSRTCQANVTGPQKAVSTQSLVERAQVLDREGSCLSDQHPERWDEQERRGSQEKPLVELKTEKYHVGQVRRSGGPRATHLFASLNS